jgi:formamidopyrimidine-DNA glycosylase
MQALAERLEDLYSGSVLKRLDLMQFSALKTVAPGPADLHGRALGAVGRRGKFLIFDLSDDRLLLHLSQGGRIDVEPQTKATKPKGSVARLHFEDRGSLLVKEYGTERKAALWVLAAGDPGPLEKLGPEPFSAGFDELLATTQEKRRIHTLLRDQRFVAGIGRGFSDDVLHHARVSPFATAAAMSESERKGLLASIRTVLTEATERERARTGGLPAKMRDRFTVHNRHGQPCPRCGETLHRISYESHEVTYCAPCQTGGKILADRRMSRLLR